MAKSRATARFHHSPHGLAKHDNRAVVVQATADRPPGDYRRLGKPGTVSVLSLAKENPAIEHSVILNGIPVAEIRRVAKVVGISPDDMAKRCGLSRSAYRRKVNRNGKLSAIISDMLARYAALLSRSIDAFEGDENAARTWLTTKQPGLGDVVPLDFARTTVGWREVENLLTRIDHGVYV